MSKRDIVKDGDPLLRKVCREVTAFDGKLAKILDDMLETLKAADGVGLAAPQIGLMRRFAICIINEQELLEIVNPVILEQSGEAIMTEGCLSCPNNWKEVKRPDHIKLKYFDRNGVEHIRDLEGFNARVCCHEIDHLDGILFYDKAVEK
ncbi:MAG: peptide deformylase [Clostridia bacterium]|nr:peptide deformylase [Clostridia bacterium]